MSPAEVLGLLLGIACVLLPVLAYQVGRRNAEEQLRDRIAVARETGRLQGWEEAHEQTRQALGIDL
jgi:hypothetical protein